MGGIIGKKLDKEILTNEYEYFFTFLNDRFELATKLWITELEKKFNKKFKPIWIMPALQSRKFLNYKKNYIIINKELQKIKRELALDKAIYLQDYEDLNKEFCESTVIKELIQKLTKKQGRVFILDFTSSCLHFESEKVIILGPKPDIATHFDNKAEHIRLFEKLDLPRNKTRIYPSIKEVKKHERYPFFISASYTSGGQESSFIYREEDLDVFHSKMRTINKTSELLVADLVRNIISSPNVNAIITGKEKTSVICITDQILRGHQYLGNIYPSKISKEQEQKIIKVTKTIGKHLSNLGFRGMFGLDFIIDSKNNLYTIDLNPRRQGGYLCNILMTKKINLIEMELKLALGEQVEEIKYKDCQVDYYWAHSKIKPYYRNMNIKDSYKWGEYSHPFNQIGSTFKCLFYPPESLLVYGNGGYMIVSGKSYEEVRKRIVKEVEIAISTDFELYEGLG